MGGGVLVLGTERDAGPDPERGLTPSFFQLPSEASVGALGRRRNGYQSRTASFAPFRFPQAPPRPLQACKRSPPRLPSQRAKETAGEAAWRCFPTAAALAKETLFGAWSLTRSRLPGNGERDSRGLQRPRRGHFHTLNERSRSRSAGRPGSVRSRPGGRFGRRPQ